MRTTQLPAAGTTRRAIFPTVVVGQARGDEPSILISTGAIDRVGDVLIPAGCDLTEYRRNPVVLYGHDHDELPIGMTTSITADDAGLRASWRWLENDERANPVRNAWNQGVLRAASVGFRPTEFEDNEEDGYTFTKWELVEWSIVPVPANPEAVRTLKRLGLDAGVPRGLPRRRWSEVDRALQLISALNVRVKQGRVLSAANESRIRQAVQLLTEVLQQLDANTGDKVVLVLDDDAPASRFGARSLVHETDQIDVPMAAREIAALTIDAVVRHLSSAVTRLTGQID